MDMDEEYEMEELADMAVTELREFIDTESQFIEEEHDLISKMMSWDYIIGHLDERIPENLKHLHELNKGIALRLDKIRRLINFGLLYDLRIFREEKQVLSHLEKHVEHREWRAVRKDMFFRTRHAGIIIRVQKKELKDLHSKFIGLMKLMKRSNLISVIEEDLTTEREKEEYVKLEAELSTSL